MWKWKQSLKTAAILAVWAGGAGADYSPMRAGDVWVYDGVGMGQPTGGVTELMLYNTQRIQFKEKLTLTFMGTTMKRDTLIHTVRERDSLYARDAYKRLQFYDSLIGTVADTVVIRDLVYKEYGGRFHLVKGDSLHYGHADTTDLFFYSRTTVPYSNGRLEGYPILTASWMYAPSGTFWVSGGAWYMQNVGLYWAKLTTGCGQCGCTGSRELKLSTYRGASVDPGIDPPGSALAKEAKISCGVKAPIRAYGYGLTADWSGGAVDLMGRSRRTAGKGL